MAVARDRPPLTGVDRAPRSKADRVFVLPTYKEPVIFQADAGRDTRDRPIEAVATLTLLLVDERLLHGMGVLG